MRVVVSLLAVVGFGCGPSASGNGGDDESGSSSSSGVGSTSGADDGSVTGESTTGASDSSTTGLPEPPEGCSWTPQDELHCFDSESVIPGTEGLEPGGVGDFDGDGNADLWASNAGELVVVFGGGDGTFDPISRYAEVRDPYRTGDFDGDGRTDIVAGGAVDDDDMIEVWFGETNRTYDVPTTLAGALNNMWAGDLDADGNFDLVRPPFFAMSQALGILYGDGVRGFEAGPDLDYPPLGVGSPVGGDLDGDGTIDLLVNTGLLRVLAGLGDRQFDDLGEIPREELPSAWSGGNGLGHSPTVRFIHDFDGDGLAEVVVDGDDPYSTQVGVFTLQGAGYNSLWNPWSWVWAGEAVPDFNGDGRADLIINDYMDDKTLHLVWGDASQGFSDEVSVSGPGVTFAASGDFNGDDLLDLVYYADTFIVRLARP